MSVPGATSANGHSLFLFCFVSGSLYYVLVREGKRIKVVPWVPCIQEPRQ